MCFFYCIWRDARTQMAYYYLQRDGMHDSVTSFVYREEKVERQLGTLIGMSGYPALRSISRNTSTWCFFSSAPEVFRGQKYRLSPLVVETFDSIFAYQRRLLFLTERQIGSFLLFRFFLNYLFYLKYVI